MRESGPTFDQENNKGEEKVEDLQDLYGTLSLADQELVDHARKIADEYIDRGDISGLSQLIKTSKGENRFPLYSIGDRDLLKKIGKLFSDEVKEKIKLKKKLGGEKTTLKKEKSESELLPEKLPVVVHRWFPNGAGWSYHSSLNEESLINVIKDLDSVLFSSKIEDSGVVEMAGGGWVVYSKRPDINSKDPKAKNRSPFYLTAVLLRGGKPEGKMLDEIYKEIESLPEVEKKGGQDYLSVGGSK